MKKIRLTDLISIEALQQIQDGFSEYTGMAALTTDANGVPVTKGSGFTKFCMQLTRTSEQGLMHCEKCDKTGAMLTLKNGHATVYDCHAGLTDFAAPIMIEGNVIGCFIGGQVRTQELDLDRLRKTARLYKIDPEEYVQAANQTAIIPRENIEKAAHFLEEIAKGLSDMAYKSYMSLKESNRMEKASKSQADFVMNMSMNLEHSMQNWFNKVDDKIQETDNKEIRDFLTGMQYDGLEMRSNIRDTIDYIRMSASKIEIMETEYSIKKLKTLLELGTEDFSKQKNIPININIGECSTDSLFGDLGRIGQMLTKTIKTLTNNKQNGSIDLTLSTDKISYATMLCITIADKESSISAESMHKVESYFNDNSFSSFSETDEIGMWLSLEAILLKKMSGSISFEHSDNTLFMKIILPQLAV